MSFLKANLIVGASVITIIGSVQLYQLAIKKYREYKLLNNIRDEVARMLRNNMVEFHMMTPKLRDDNGNSLNYNSETIEFLYDRAMEFVENVDTHIMGIRYEDIHPSLNLLKNVEGLENINLDVLSDFCYHFDLADNQIYHLTRYN